MQSQEKPKPAKEAIEHSISGLLASAFWTGCTSEERKQHWHQRKERGEKNDGGEGDTVACQTVRRPNC